VYVFCGLFFVGYWMSRAQVMFHHSPVEIPIDLRARLEAARLDLPAPFLALDRINLAPEQIPQRLIRQLFELDADYVDAPRARDQPPGTLNPWAMLRDTLAALERLATAFNTLPSPVQPTLSQLELTFRVSLSQTEACNIVPRVRPPKTVQAPMGRKMGK
jgi:hypothetical protein